MCGLTGYFTPGGFEAASGAQIVSRMTARIQTRGPDAQTHWCDDEAGIALGHARLSVIELSPSGAQPMTSASGRYVLVYNGEIYNHLDLRAELDDQKVATAFRGHSDTETLLAGFETWGISGTLSRAVGMFAFALWDRKDRKLHLGRDRFGEKPLYYGWQNANGGPTLLFGSELKSLHEHPDFEKRLNRDSAARFFERHCVPGEQSIFDGIAKVAPATFLTFSADQRDPVETVYWSLADAITTGANARFTGDENDLNAEMDARLSRAVKRQMLSDVPLGAFLSGGVDSSTIVAQMCRFSSSPVKTFTIGFNEEGFDESAYAAAVAQHLGTDHTRLTVTTEDAQDVVPRLSEIYDEPFADVSQIPTFIVSHLARQHVTVSLTGDGADELFAGYSRYGKTLSAWGMRGKLPSPVWSAAAPLARQVERMSQASSSLGRAGRLAGLFANTSLTDYYAEASNFARLNNPVRGRGPGRQRLTYAATTDLEKLGEFDVRTYMADDILVKVDRAAMAVSLETRAPFLDHELAEFAFSLPPHLKQLVRAGKTLTKWPLRQQLYQHVPEKLIERPKMGFGVPIGDWLRGGLKDWGASYLLDPALGADGLLDAGLVGRLWADHQSRKADNSAVLWATLMFCTWREKWL